MMTILGCLLGQVYAKDYPIQATMIKPQMQNDEYQVENIQNDNFLGTLVCTNGHKVKIYDRKEVYIPEDEGWDAEKLIHLSIFGDVLAKAIESKSVFVGGNTSWPIVVGAEVAKEGIVDYSNKHQVDETKKENALSVTAGVSTGASVANLAIAAGATNPLGAFVGIVGGAIAYNQASHKYELQREHAGQIKVLTFFDHPTRPEKVYACE